MVALTALKILFLALIEGDSDEFRECKVQEIEEKRDVYKKRLFFLFFHEFPRNLLEVCRDIRASRSVSLQIIDSRLSGNFSKAYSQPKGFMVCIVNGRDANWSVLP